MRKDGSTGEAYMLRSALHGPLDRRDVESRERSLALVCRALFGETSEQLRVGRFELTATLGRGGMGIAYEARDPLHDRPIALKMLHQRGPLSLYRLKREFRSLAQLRHPNLVRLYELFVERDTAYFTMERVQGTDFVSYVRLGVEPGALPDETRLRDALAQLCEGVRALHDAGKLHRDLKPANVLVTEAGRVVLLDFGLVHDVHDGSVPAEGTPAFMAPEQRHGQTTQASDWYSVGCMLRDALYGPAPRTHAATPSPAGSPRASLPLVALCEQLLAVEPERRVSIDPWWIATGALSPVRSSKPPPFTGREAELHSLRAAFERCPLGPTVVLLRGASGIGKTALMNHFALATTTRGALVLRGHCYERESVAYNAFDGIVDELTRHLSSLADEQVRALRPADCDA
ncbi:MAG: Serine/threonine-protein kinase PknB, partial [Pseudomonadota bacterium]